VTDDAVERDPECGESESHPDFAQHPLATLDDLIWRVSWDARPKYRGALHAASAFLAPPAALAMVLHAKPGRNRIAAGVYGAGLCGMFAASGAYHRLTRSRRMFNIMRRIDHSTIYVMIAGTWTPIAVAVLPPKQAKYVVGAVWGAAASAIAAKVAMLDEVNRAGSWFYPVLGVAGAFLAPDVVRIGGPAAISGLVAGGVAYLGGAAVFAAKKPDPWPDTFGFHEIFHTAVVVGVISHYAVLWRLLRRSGSRP
jgi:hemolysin III